MFPRGRYESEPWLVRPERGALASWRLGQLRAEPPEELTVKSQAGFRQEPAVRILAGPGHQLNEPGAIACLADGDILIADGPSLWRLEGKRSGPGTGEAHKLHLVVSKFVSSRISLSFCEFGCHIRDLQVHPCSARCTVHFDGGEPPVVVDLRTGTVDPVEGYGTVNPGAGHYDYGGDCLMRFSRGLAYVWDNAGAGGGRPAPGQSVAHPNGQMLLLYTGCRHIFAKEQDGLGLAIFREFPSWKRYAGIERPPESAAVCESGTIVVSSRGISGGAKIAVVPPGGEPRQVVAPRLHYLDRWNRWDSLKSVKRMQDAKLSELDAAMSVAVDDKGNLWLSSWAGVYMMPKCGLDAGYHLWSPTVKTAFWSVGVHHTLCTPRARAVVWAVLLSGERVAGVGEGATPELPPEIWVSIMRFVMVCRLGA